MDGWQVHFYFAPKKLFLCPVPALKQQVFICLLFLSLFSLVYNLTAVMLSIFGSWFFCSPPLPSQEHCTPLGWCSSEVPLNTQHSSILNAVLCVLTKLWLFHSSSEKKLMNSGFTEQVSTVSAPVVTRTSDVGASLEDRRNSQCGNDLQPAYLLSLWLFQNSWKFPGWVVSLGALFHFLGKPLAFY